MSNYLDVLIARTLHAADMVRPRPLSRFEQPVISDLSPQPELSGEEVTNRAFPVEADDVQRSHIYSPIPSEADPSPPNANHIAEKPPLPPAQASPRPRRAADEHATHIIDPEPPLIVAPPPLVTPPTPRPRAPSPEGTPVLQPHPTLPDPIPVKPGRHSTAADRGITANQPPPDRSAAARKTISETPPHERPAALDIQAVAREVRSLLANDPTPPTLPKDPPSQRITARDPAQDQTALYDHRLPPTNAAPPPARLEPAEPEPPYKPPDVPPTINVRIGTVEVRATMPPTAETRRTSKKTTIMSLEEYLRQHSNGGKR